MQLFLRAQNTHTLEVNGQETVGQIKVKKMSTSWREYQTFDLIVVIIWMLFCLVNYKDHSNGIK